MKVLHLVWNLIRGGTEGQCARVAMELARRGDVHRVAVFRREGYFLDRVEQQCGPVVEVGIRKMVSLATLKAIRAMATFVQQEKVQVVHAWDADAAIFGQLIAAWSGVPLITSRRDLGHIYPSHKRWLMRCADRRARFIVANAQAIVDEFSRQGGPREKFRVIPNILDLDETIQQQAMPFPRMSELPPGERVVMVARLDPEKDVTTFLYAAELIVKAHPEASFVIAGDGVEKKALMEMARLHQLSDRMIFLGDTREIPALLAACRVGVLTPSRNEGLSNTILEYMAAGLPVVATDCGGNRELVQPPNGGMITGVGEYHEIAKHVVELLRQPQKSKAMGEFNRRQIAARFQPQPVADQFAALYRETLSRH